MISVVMLTYNREKLVGRMIECVLHQTVQDFEYIIVNNGSTDHTAELLEQYREKSEKIRVLACKAPISIGAARNLGVREAKGEYLTFVDDDDYLAPDYLEYLSDLITEFDARMAVAGTQEERDGVVRPQCVFEERECLTGEQAVCELLKRRRIRAGTAAKLVLTDIFRANPFPEACVHEDIHVTYRLLADAGRVAMGGKPIYGVFLHGGNVSFFTSDKACWTSDKLTEYVGAFKVREQYIGERFPGSAEYARYCTYSYEISMCRQLSEAPPRGAERVLADMRRDLFENKATICEYPYLTPGEAAYMEMVK